MSASQERVKGTSHKADHARCGCRRTAPQQVAAHTAWLNAVLAPVHATAQQREAVGMSERTELVIRRALRGLWERPDTRATLEIVDRHIQDGSLGLQVHAALLNPPPR